jgi:hypothetical protein
VLFTGGVDSFYSLLKYPSRIDAVLFVEGMDIAIGDHGHRELVREEIRSVADAMGIAFLNVSTNLREHPLFRSMDYNRTHGAGLTASAHVLTRHVGHLVVSSSTMPEVDVPLGTHWDTDPLWSSAALTVEHWGHHIWRWDKLSEIMDEPLVRAHLRVCFANVPGQLNCRACEKCVRTMIHLHQHGRLASFPTMSPPVDLQDSIDRVKRVKRVTQFTYDGYLARERKPEIREAIRRLLKRSRGPLKALYRMRYRYGVRPGSGGSR